ncbi:Cyclin A [Carabus blaptoides fortunei]
MVNTDPHATKVHPLILYSDYIIEIIENLLMNQEKHMLESYFITNFDVRSVHRAAVINWLVKLQQFLGSDPSVLFMAVRLFDKMLSLTEIPPDLLQLVGLATYWISSKYSDIIDSPLASKLLQLCNNAYTVRALWKIENKVLRYLHFEIAVDEPIIFIVSICSNYLLDCLILDSECNVYPISFQAAAAVLMSLRLLNMDVRLWNIVKSYPGYYTPEQLRMLQTKILYIVNLVQDSNYAFREPYNKYTTEKYASISLKLSNILSAL